MQRVYFALLPRRREKWDSSWQGKQHQDKSFVCFNENPCVPVRMIQQREDTLILWRELGRIVQMWSLDQGMRSGEQEGGLALEG